LRRERKRGTRAARNLTLGDLIGNLPTHIPPHNIQFRFCKIYTSSSQGLPIGPATYGTRPGSSDTLAAAAWAWRTSGTNKVTQWGFFNNGCGAPRESRSINVIRWASCHLSPTQSVWVYQLLAAVSLIGIYGQVLEYQGMRLACWLADPGCKPWINARYPPTLPTLHVAIKNTNTKAPYSKTVGVNACISQGK
jgi:hypothetical protein